MTREGWMADTCRSKGNEGVPPTVTAARKATGSLGMVNCKLQIRAAYGWSSMEKARIMKPNSPWSHFHLHAKCQDIPAARPHSIFFFPRFPFFSVIRHACYSSTLQYLRIYCSHSVVKRASNLAYIDSNSPPQPFTIRCMSMFFSL